jgi:glycosyltransferase involved in cell wall biosynthesis
LTKPLKIALTADPEIPVPPIHYGGIERIIDMLIKGYLERGHQVTLFAHADSQTDAHLKAYPGKSSGRKADFLKNSWLINRTLLSGEFDVIHSFGRLAYLLPQLPRAVPKLMSYQREPTLGQISKAVKLAKKNTLAFTGCSGYISRQIEPLAPSFAVFNGVPLDVYTFRESVAADAPLAFLGRIEPIKGTHIAVEVARATGRRLQIAGNIPAEGQTYFEEKIKPFLNDRIEYIGPVNDAQKNRMLGESAAFLMPIEWNEPFGIVMAEALACGTPVIGFRRGSVPEVVIEGYNGFSCNTAEEMIALISRIPELDRRNARKDAEERFSADVIVDHYLSIYHQLINKLT